MRLTQALTFVALTQCSVVPLNPFETACPCASGWTCDESLRRCVPGIATDAAPVNDAAATLDATNDSSADASLDGALVDVSTSTDATTVEDARTDTDADSGPVPVPWCPASATTCESFESAPPGLSGSASVSSANSSAGNSSLALGGDLRGWISLTVPTTPRVAVRFRIHTANFATVPLQLTDLVALYRSSNDYLVGRMTWNPEFSTFRGLVREPDGSSVLSASFPGTPASWACVGMSYDAAAQSVELAINGVTWSSSTLFSPPTEIRVGNLGLLATDPAPVFYIDALVVGADIDIKNCGDR